MEGSLQFVKYHGVGDDFILVDNRDSPEPKLTSEQAVKLCNRNFGVGANAVVFAMPSETTGADYAMRIFNNDGTEFKICGNGIRCFARFVNELDNLDGKQSFTVHTAAGLRVILEIKDDGKVRVDMGEPIIIASDVPTKLSPTKDETVIGAELEVDGINWIVTCVNMGIPHCVTFGTKEGHEVSGRMLPQTLHVDELQLPDFGPLFEQHEVFPSGIVTEFVQIISRSHLKARVWERGAGEILACGTGACAVVVAGVLEGHSERSCTVDFPGGSLEIEWRQEDNHVYMSGPAEMVFRGSICL